MECLNRSEVTINLVDSLENEYVDTVTKRVYKPEFERL